MTKKTTPASDASLPEGLGAPAMRALTRVGILSLSGLTKVTEGELLALHGFGPKALSVLTRALEERGLSLAHAPARVPARGAADAKTPKGRRS